MQLTRRELGQLGLTGTIVSTVAARGAETSDAGVAAQKPLGRVAPER